MRVLTWNLDWASHTAPSGVKLTELVQTLNPDLAIFTEATIPWLEQLGGHLALADADYGYNAHSNRRKVAIWSSDPIHAIDRQGSPDLPSGRFVQGTTHGLNIVGLCIPWSDAHVHTGRKDKARWQDHAAYIKGLSDIAVLRGNNLVVGGDFNQRNPRYRQPQHLFDDLQQTLGHLRWMTEGHIPPVETLSIDHILTSLDIEAGQACAISNLDVNGSKLSDHFGVYCDLQC